MSKRLTIITRKDPNEVGDAPLIWPRSAPYVIGEDLVLVIDGADLPPVHADEFLTALGVHATVVANHAQRFDEHGVIVHPTADFTEACINGLAERFGVDRSRIKRYSTGDTTGYRIHEELGAACRNSTGDRPAKLQAFWTHLFKDPVLEDLILLLQTHARKKSEGEPIEDLETLKGNVVGNGGVQQNGNEIYISDQAAQLVAAHLDGRSGYDALRTALVEAVKARHSNPNG